MDCSSSFNQFLILEEVFRFIVVPFITSVIIIRKYIAMLRIKKELNFDNYRDTNIQQLEIINFLVEKHEMKVFKGTNGKG